jgi:hypothetical protein
MIVVLDASVAIEILLKRERNGIFRDVMNSAEKIITSDFCLLAGHSGLFCRTMWKVFLHYNPRRSANGVPCLLTAPYGSSFRQGQFTAYVSAGNTARFAQSVIPLDFNLCLYRPCFFRYRDTQKRVIAATKSPRVKIICITISASQPVYKNVYHAQDA